MRSIGVEALALREQRERDAPGAPARELGRAVDALALDPLGVAGLEIGGEPPDVAAVHGRQRAADGDDAGSS
ncbi:MAG: hypothetical protein KatS3mg009_3301 [Acidimicrobiia bacterium]|nr:MAG: hypothetical protein KatS3mg009_3301 [Acidimicrobiia bacterium]